MFRNTDIKTVPLIFIVDNNKIDIQNPNKYSVELPSTYKDVISIELIKASFGITNKPAPPALPIMAAADMYITLNLNNYSRTLGNSTQLNSTFCTIINDYLVDGRINYTKAGSQPDESYIYYFSEPAKISKFNIELLKQDGSAVTGPHVLIFEIRSLAQARF